MCVIRRAVKEDLPLIYRLEVEVFGEDAWDPLTLAFFIFLDKAVFLVCSSGKSIIGYAIGVVEKGNVGHLVNIAVSTISRRKGVGSLLLKTVERELKRSGCKEIYLEVKDTNDIARRFYEKNGYVLSGYKKRYYRDGRDALVFKKII